MSSGRLVLIDTDPGIDDAMAIAVAVAAPSIDVLGLTTVFGNHHVDTTTANAQRVLDHLGRPDIPVVEGAHRPLLRAPGPPATFVHGDDGLGDIGLPPPSREPLAARHAAVHIVETARAHPGELTLVTLGPLTNLAMAVRLEPRLVALLDEVIVMGGAARVAGNVTDTSEANIWNDPHAAEIVCAAGFPLTMIGLDVTHQLLADRRWLGSLEAVGTPAADLVVRTAPTYLEFHRLADGLDGIHCHDVATIAYLLQPELFALESLRVRVVTDGFTAGHTVVSSRPADGDDGERPPVSVATGVDADAVLALVHDHLCR